MKWSVCHLGTELDTLMGTSHSIFFILSLLGLAGEFISKSGAACILNLIQIVIIFVFILLSEKGTKDTGAEGSLYQ